MLPGQVISVSLKNDGQVKVVFLALNMGEGGGTRGERVGGQPYTEDDNNRVNILSCLYLNLYKFSEISCTLKAMALSRSESHSLTFSIKSEHCPGLESNIDKVGGSWRLPKDDTLHIARGGQEITIWYVVDSKLSTLQIFYESLPCVTAFNAK